MFETILEKILIQYFGKFISGLDKNNLKLGVWSGNVVIENVNLKSEIIELLELPIILSKSKVGRLIIKIPWKKLTSQPVEITIENVYVTLSPMKELIFDDRVIVEKKIESIITYFKKCIKKGTKQKKEKDKGYFDKIALKIMDNIQLKIVNIHVRYEANYCWGVTMEMLEIYSTNQAWQRSFIERPENQNQSLNKLFQLKNLAFYWNINKDEEALLNYDNFMDERVLKANLTAKEFCNFIVVINAEMKVIQNDPSTMMAQQDMKLELEDIYLLLKQKQFQQMVHFFNFCSKYSKLLWVQKKQSQSLQENVQSQQKRFDMILKKIAFQGIEQLEQEERQQLQSIVRVVKNNILLEWVSITACQIVKESKQNKALQEKIKKENAWWKSEKKKQPKEIELSQEEILTINSQIDKFFQEYKNQISNRSDDSLETQFQFMIHKGCFKLENSRDGLELNFEKLQIQFETKVDQSVDALFKLSNLSSDLILENQNFPFFYKATLSEKLDQFVKFHFQKHPKSSDIYASFMFQIEPIECKYNKQILQQWDIYFNTEEMKENNLETVVLQSIHEAGNQTANIMETFINSQYRVQIFILIANPKVIINELIFNFGTISIQSEKEQKEYDQYTLSIDELNLKSKEIEILKQLSLQLQIERLKAGLDHLNMPRLILSGMLPPLELKLTEQLFEQIKQIENEIFPEKTLQQKQRSWKKEKHVIVKNSTYQSFVHKKMDNILTQYYLIISGNYLYCYKNKEDLQWSERMNTKDIDVKDNQEELIIFGEQIWILQVENEQKSELKLLLSNLDQKQIIQDDQIDKSLLQVQLKISSLKIGLFNEYQSLYSIHLEDMFYRSHKQTYKFENSLIIGEFQIIDYTLNLQNENQKILIQKNKECKDALLTIENIIEQNCSRTKVSFSILEINWNPDSFLAIRELGNYLDKLLGIETQKNQRMNIKEKNEKNDILQLLQSYKERNFETSFYNFFDDLIDRKKAEELCLKNNIFFKNWSFSVGTQIELQIQSLKLNLMLRKSHLQIGYIEIIELSHIAEFTQNGKFFNGNLRNFKVHDSTQTRSNYNIDKKQLIEIINLQEIQYKWTSYKKELYKDSSEIITSLCYFSALDVFIEYHHLTINRFLNYLNFQIIQLLNNPLLLTINDGEYSELEKDEIFIHQIFNSLKNPQFPLYKYKLQNVKLNLKKCYNDQHTLNFTFPLLNYQNQFILQKKNLLLQQNFEDQNLIGEKGIYDIKNGQLMLDNVILVQNLDFKYNQIKPIMELEFKNVFKEQFQSVLQIDLQQFSQILVTLTKQNYLMMCTILAHNILQNDEQDQIYIYDFNHYSKLKQTEIQANLIYDNLFFKLSEFNISICLQNTKIQINQIGKSIQLKLEANKYEINLENKIIASNENTIYFKQTNLIKNDLQNQQLNQKKLCIQYNVQQNASSLIMDVFECQSYGGYQCYLQILEFLELDSQTFPEDKEKQGPKNEVIILNWKGTWIFSNEFEQDILVINGSTNLILELQKLKKLHKITFSNLEAFLYKPQETEFDFTQRQILFPLFIHIKVKENDENRSIQIEVSADDLKVLLSQNDFQVLHKIYLYQKQQLNQFSFNQQKLEQNKNKEVLVEFNAQIHHSSFQLIQFFENNVPLFSFELKDSQLKYVKKNKYLMNCSTVFEIQFFNLDIGTWEPIIEPLQLVCDHSVDQFGNPKQFTSISLNENNSYPTNINFTKESIKALIEILRKISNLQKQQEPQNEIGRRTSSIISRSSSIIQQNSRKIITISPYVLENQTGYQIELTVIINNYNQKKYHSQVIENQEEYGIQFEGRDEKRTFSVMIISKEFKFSQLCNLNFTKRADTAKLISYKIGQQEKQTRIIIQLQMKDQQKRMILCSEIKFFNQTTENIEVEIINKNTQQHMILILKSQAIQYLPLGFELSMIRFQYQRNGVWSQLMEVQKLTQKNANYNLFINQPFLILSIQKPIITTMPIVLNLLSPFAIKNLLILPIDILIQENFQRVESNQSLHIFQSSLQKGIQFKFKLPGFHPTQFIEVNLQFQSKEITIRDYFGLELQLFLNQIQDGEGLFTVAIDGGLTIINSLGMDLYYFTKTQQDLQYQPGQPIKQITEEEDKLREKGNIQIINLVNNLCFSFEQLNLETGPSQVSQPLNIANDGTVLFQIPIDQGYMDILIEISSSQFYETSNKKIININPKYVIINNLNTNLTIQQDRSNQEILIMPGSKFPYYWAKMKNQQLIKFKKKDQQSGVISVLQLGSVLLPLRNQSGQLVDYISVNILEEDKIRYIVIQETKQKPLYHLINQLNYDIQFYQSKLQDLNFNIKTNLPQNSSVDYSFDNPGLKNSIILELYKDGEFSNFLEVQLANQNSQIEYEMIDNETFYLNSEFSLELQQMVVILSNERKISHKINYDHLNNKFIFYTPKIFISIINSHPREELITISIDKFEFIRLQDILDTIQLRIENLQIDNNQQSRCTYPVLLTQQNQQQQAQQIPIISFLLRRAHKINYINYYETVKLAIQPITIKITEGTYDQLEEYLKSLKWIEENQPIKLRVWQIEKKILQQLYFFETLEIYPINMQLSFQKIGNKKRQYFKSAASQAVNCDEVNILIKGYSIRNCYTSIEQLENKMKQNYQEALQSQIYKIAASIDLLGNPAGLISNVGEGFSDLIEMPYEGFIQGPLEGGLGIVKGMGSLTKGVVSGTFNSVSKITGSVASGISQLSMDDQYLQMRQNQNSKKPKTVVHGLGQGMISLFSGVGHGISGLVVQPYQGAEQGGVGGFFKGVSKGLAGLVVKPVAGALDLVSKTSEGVKNTANFFDDKPNEKRERLPRVFYGFEQKFKNYTLQDAEIMYILERLRPGQVLIDTFVYNITKYKFAYVITEELFILLEILKKQVLIQFSHDNLKAFECSGKEFRIYLYKPQIDFKERAKVKAQIIFDQKKSFLQINQQEKVIHEFLNYYLERILLKDF